jgi:hypothetical protein
MKRSIPALDKVDRFKSTNLVLRTVRPVKEIYPQGLGWRLLSAEHRKDSI